MAEKRGYQPSLEEIQKAESMMTPEQKKISALREQKLEELKAGEAAIKADLEREKKIKPSILKLEVLLNRVEAHWQTVYGHGEEDDITKKEWEFPKDMALWYESEISDKVKQQLKRLLLKRRKQGLPELQFKKLSFSRLSIAREGVISNSSPSISEYEPHYDDEFRQLAKSPMWVVSTENSSPSESDPNLYKPEDLVIVFTHPVEAARAIPRYIDDLKEGRVDGFPAGKVILVEDFVEEIETYGMPGDPKLEELRAARAKQFDTEYGLYDKDAFEALQERTKRMSINSVANYFRARADVFRHGKNEDEVKHTKLFDNMANAVSVEKPRKSDLEQALKMIEGQYYWMKKWRKKDTGILYGDIESMDAMRHFLKNELNDQSGKYAGMSDKEIEEGRARVAKTKIR